MQDDADFSVRYMAAKALINIGDEPAVDVLVDTLKNNDAKMREIAADALGYLENQRAFPALMCAEMTIVAP